MTQAEFIRGKLKTNLETPAKEILDAWNKGPQGKDFPMQLRAVYQIRSKIRKIRKNKTSMEGLATKSRAKLAQPTGLFTYPANNPHPGYVRNQLCAMEDKLELLIQEARELKDNELTEAMRQCRRIIGKSILAKK